MFIECIDPSCKTLIGQYSQDHADISVTPFVNHAKSHGVVGRAREKKTEKITVPSPPSLRKHLTKTPHTQWLPLTSAHYFEEASDSRGNSEPLVELKDTAEE